MIGLIGLSESVLTGLIFKKLKSDREVYISFLYYNVAFLMYVELLAVISRGAETAYP